ncbi:hypothetical protein [Streptomyces sp. NPDC050560]|uniref:hypothetical protein n=1 Tax=Streptomyces sp. NPDC050560 TaxID=3365630 RepID=UPI0037B9876C
MAQDTQRQIASAARLNAGAGSAPGPSNQYSNSPAAGQQAYHQQAYNQGQTGNRPAKAARSK